MNYVYAAFSGYLIGCVNISYLYGRRRGLDIRKTGTKNAGATNALMTFGPIFGLITALCDIGKTVFAYYLATALFNNAYIGSVSAAACIAGHIYPVFMGLRGGKGIAPFGGFVLASDWRVFLFLLAAVIILLIITDYGILSSNIAVAFYPLYLFAIKKPPLPVFVSASVSLLIIWKHRTDLKRVFNGSETPASSVLKSLKGNDNA